MNIFYIYVYLDPRKPGIYKYDSYKFDYEPFYVGKGKNERWKDISHRSKYFKRIINKIKKSGSEPIIIKLEENLNEEKSFISELKLIEIIGRKDLKRGPLLNFTNGGEGSNGYIHSEEWKTERSKRMTGKNNPIYKKYGDKNPFFGKHHSEYTKNQMSKNHAYFKGENNPASTLKEKDVIEIRKDLKKGIKQREIAKKYNVHFTTISKIKTRKYWTHIGVN